MDGGLSVEKLSVPHLGVWRSIPGIPGEGSPPLCVNHPMRKNMQPGVSRYHPTEKRKLVPNDQYTCHVPHILSVDFVAR